MVGLHSLEEARFVLVLNVRSKLDLGLDPGEQTGLVEGDGVRAVQDVVPGLEHKYRFCNQRPPPKCMTS